ncbi:ubl carboxyl-terminal hydrolase 18 [Astyanax mexicanus]|uniref:ubl carboxyl-terminal hydrolase 18 n=1 Tax=Astyanax mexicanus TaxID=7994 RepID=UPI0020CB3000|nr:ubl carboxyl-terminal hydrolase 18 [Astyanax mexicanus]XP_049331079.1 ubl carboxyl-terminal hydrolase 18 [Astyanax mexicanus]
MGISCTRSAMYVYCRSLAVRGLSNCGLSCCINALLQSFSATPELFNLLNRWLPPDDFRDHCNVPLELKSVLYAMRDQLQPAPHRDFLNCLHHNSIHCFTQHDADEVFHIILNLIKKQMPDQDLAAEIHNLFKIVMEGQIKCLKCAYVHHIPNFSLSLPLHLSEQNNTLEQCIQAFFKMQPLDGSEQFWCDRCDEKRPVAQGLKIVSLPSILCIHLKRFRNDSGSIRKLNCRVTFPESFSTDILTEHATENMLKGMYTLYAVIVHSGSTHFGHYTAYICSPKDCTWYYTDDSHVRQASWKDVQQTYEGRSGTAYMLLYRRSSSEALQDSPE